MLRRGPLARSLTALVVSALLCAGTAARAEPPPSEAELAQARERFGAARKLEDTGKWSDALALLQQVGRVKMTPQVRFHIALCQEHVGLWIEALDGYAQAAGEARGTAPEVVKESGEHLRALEPTIPTVSLKIVDGAAGDELVLDRQILPSGGAPLPMRANPGPHTAEVRRGGAVVARESFVLEASRTRRLELRVGPALDVAPATAGADTGRVQRALGWTALGIGATSAVLTGVFIGLRAGALNRLEAACPKLTRCPRSVETIVSGGKTDALLVNLFGALAGVGLAGGVVLLVTAPSAPAPSVAAPPAIWLGVSPVVGHDRTGVLLQGEF